MAAIGKKTQGLKLQLGSTTSPQTFTNMAAITGFQGLNSGGATEIDATNFDSAIKEFIRGLRDGGSATFNINFDPDQSTHQTLWNLNRQGDTRQWRVLLASGEYFEFNGFINNLQIDGSIDDILRGTMPIRIVSEPMLV
jgi:hypothetical protein